MRLASIRTIVTDGRQGSVATPYLAAAWEAGPFRTCDFLSAGRRCGKPSAQLLTWEGGSGRTWGEGRCTDHALPPLRCPVLRGAWWIGDLVTDRGCTVLHRVLEVWPTAPFLLAEDLATGARRLLEKGLDEAARAYPYRVHDAPERWYGRRDLGGSLAAYRARRALTGVGAGP